MPVKIRLARVGRSKIVKYRVVAADSRMQRDGRFLETIGSYDPQANPKKFEFKLERVMHWIKLGAQPTETVRNLLKQDRFFEKADGLAKGIPADQLNITPRPERKRKPKPKRAKKAA